MKSLLLGAALVAASALSHAASWTIGNATAVPGQTVDIPIAFAGDGATAAAEIDLTFDEVRLALPVASGAIPNANVNGQCARTTSKTVSGILYAASGALPTTSQIVCIIPFTVKSTARTGRVPLAASSKECAASNGVQTCTIMAGWIDVQGNPPAAFNAPEQLETESLVVLLESNGPSAQQLVAYDYRGDPAHAPLEGLRQGVLRVRGPNGYPAAGDFLARIQRNPESAEAKAERYVTVDFESREARENARSLLSRDPAVETVEPVVVTPINEAQPFEKSIPAAQAKGVAAGSQDFLDVLNFSGAWARAGGWGLVAAIDNGLEPNHAELRSFTGADSVGGSKVAGGNYLPYFSRNVGGRGQPVTDVDEIQPTVQQSINEEPCDVADGVDDGLLNYAFAGHGTHVAGLIAANPGDGGLRGGCSRCGLVMVKRSALYCDFASDSVIPGTFSGIDGEAIEHLYKVGVQVINMSYSNDANNCQTASNYRVCNAIATAYRNDILMVAAAGNNREQLKFPARDPHVASVGGLGASNEFWDESPGDKLSCPYADGRECGSNFAESALFRHGTPRGGCSCHVRPLDGVRGSKLEHHDRLRRFLWRWCLQRCARRLHRHINVGTGSGGTIRTGAVDQPPDACGRPCQPGDSGDTGRHSRSRGVHFFPTRAGAARERTIGLRHAERHGSRGEDARHGARHAGAQSRHALVRHVQPRRRRLCDGGYATNGHGVASVCHERLP
jgi:hypothetical protein